MRILDDKARVKASRALCYRLRHDPGMDANGDPIPMDRAGYVAVAELLGAGLREGWLEDEVAFEDLVENDPKGRFEFSPGSWDDDGLQWHLARIRACSGHSLDVDLGLKDYVPAGDLFFGTVDSRLSAILENGLGTATRRHTRLLETAEAALGVALQRRGGDPAVFRIDAQAMLADGHRFQRAHNGEVLGPAIQPGYISVVTPAFGCVPGR